MADVVDGWAVVERAAELARHGEQFALATVVWRQGPSSGQRSSRMIITASGELHGWIGGACAEPTVVREAQRAIADGEPRLLLLGQPEQFAGGVPEGMAVIPISCSSEGAMEVYVEPVLPTPHVVVVGRSPMAATLVELGRALGWAADLVATTEFTDADVKAQDVVIVATQGNGDEEAVEAALAARPAFVGLVASHKRGETVLGYLADRGVARERLDTVRVPVGLDLGHTAHREIAVSILAELVELRAAGKLAGSAPAAVARVTEAVDPVCGMTVPADDEHRPYDYHGVTYWFCAPGCRRAFEKDPESFLTEESDETQETRC
jgi:xanthine dehydrogenase accessory factor